MRFVFTVSLVSFFLLSAYVAPFSVLGAPCTSRASVLPGAAFSKICSTNFVEKFYTREMLKNSFVTTYRTMYNIAENDSISQTSTTHHVIERERTRKKTKKGSQARRMNMAKVKLLHWLMSYEELMCNSRHQPGHTRLVAFSGTKVTFEAENKATR